MEESIFTKIINGDIPCHKVYEDDRTIVFMDIHPIQTGAVLVVAKKQIDHIFDLPKEDYDAVMTTVHAVGKRLREIFPKKARVGVIIEGFDVPHVHVKVVPVDSGDELRHKPDMSAEPDHSALARIAEQLRF